MSGLYEHIEIVVHDERQQLQVSSSPPHALVLEVLLRHHCLLLRPWPRTLDTARWDEVIADFRLTADLPAAGPVFLPPGKVPPRDPSPDAEFSAGIDAPAPASSSQKSAATGPAARYHPESITDRDATILVYGKDIDEAAQHLKAGNSVLIVCEKMVVDHLWEEIAGRAGLEPDNPFHEASARSEQTSDALALPDPANELADLAARLDRMNGASRGYRGQLLSVIRDRIRTSGVSRLLVLPHLDLFVGTGRSEMALSSEAREFADLLYPTAPSKQRSDGDRAQLLAFADPSLTLPEVVTQLFVRLRLEGCHRTVLDQARRELPLGQAVVTARERAAFDFEEQDFYKHVAGMNPVRVRQAMRYAGERFPHGGGSMDDLRDALRDFKEAASAGFEQPKESFGDIGGYQDVKDVLEEAAVLIEGSQGPDASEYLGLAPRGFVFHGPPGTGKTLFAKAIAHRLEASVMVVSGPEVNGMWHGESEGRIRDLFAQARRNAPSVLVFDEFDAIAQARSDLPDSSRAGNAVVAQILTEMDGFRADVIMLVIATTNRLTALDPALLRPSRFHAVEIGLPDDVARAEILRYYDGKHGTRLDPELLKALTAFTKGWNGDMLQEIFRQAHRLRLLKQGWSAGVEQVAEIAGRVSLTMPAARETR